MLGLLKKSNPRSLLFKTRFGIHTFFLRTAIDVLVLDEKHAVQAVKESLRPNRVYFWNPKYPLVLELLKGSVRKSKTSVGDHLKLVF